ncbi:hypothetical protein K0M31_007895 [Melipona bicolor]|uniref:Uncharacterized protein n=1 Tax=Melipona bicolor TaxID=60889 RepID=A0AA40GCC8_9HYME|nr:hypothetical protein K0M31_007895 [Melipona bicolor]
MHSTISLSISKMYRNILNFVSLIIQHKFRKRREEQILIYSVFDLRLPLPPLPLPRSRYDPAGSQYPEQPSNKRREGEQLLEKRNILALGETSCDIRSRCQNSRRSSGELATVTTYSPGRIRFYSVAKSSNLCGAATLPRVCEPAGSRYAAEKKEQRRSFGSYCDSS